MRAKDSAHALATADSRYVFAICGSRTNYVIRPRVGQCSDFFYFIFFFQHMLLHSWVLSFNLSDVIFFSVSSFFLMHCTLAHWSCLMYFFSFLFFYTETACRQPVVRNLLESFLLLCVSAPLMHP